jgi:hypothetical protein
MRKGGSRLLSRIHLDERGIVVGFLVRIVLVMVLAGLLVEEGGQIVVAQIRAQGAARAAAQAAADAWAVKHDAEAARRVAVAAARESNEGAKVESVSIAANGEVTVRVREVAHTTVVQRVGFLEHFGVRRATETQGRST